MGCGFIGVAVRPHEKEERLPQAGRLRLLKHKLRPRTTERLPDSSHGRQQDVNLPGFDFLHRPNVQLGQLRQPLLRHALRVAFPTHVRSEISQLRGFFAVEWHASLRRQTRFPVNGTTGRKIILGACARSALKKHP